MRINHGHTAMLVSSVLFGINFTTTKSIVNINISAVGLNEMRFIAGGIVFWLLSLAKPEPVSLKDKLLLLLGAVFGLLINQISFIQGLALTSPLDSSIIVTFLPIITLILAAIFLKEPASWLKILGVLVGASGAVLLIFASEIDQSGTSSLKGNLLCLLSGLSFAIYLILTRSISHRYSPITIMKWMFLYALIIFTPFSYKDIVSTDYASFTPSSWISMLYVMIGATVLPYLLMPYAQSRLRPTTLAMYNYVQPIMVALLAAITGQDTYTATKAFAAILVFVGVFIVTKSKSRADIEASKAHAASNEEPRVLKPE